MQRARSDFPLSEKSLLWKCFCSPQWGGFGKTSLNVCPARSWAGSGSRVELSLSHFPFALLTLLIKPQLSSVSG